MHIILPESHILALTKLPFQPFTIILHFRNRVSTFTRKNRSLVVSMGGGISDTQQSFLPRFTAKNQRGEHSIRAYRFSRRVFIAFDRPLFAVVRFDPRLARGFSTLISTLVPHLRARISSEDKKAASAFLLVPLSPFLPLLSFLP